MMIIDTVIKTG